MKKDEESWIFLSIKLGVLVPSCQLRLFIVSHLKQGLLKEHSCRVCFWNVLNGLFDVVCMFQIVPSSLDTVGFFTKPVTWLPELRMGCMERVGSLFQVRWSTSKPQTADDEIRWIAACTSCAAHMLVITRSYLEDVGTKHSVPSSNHTYCFVFFCHFFQWLQSV